MRSQMSTNWRTPNPNPNPTPSTPSPRSRATTDTGKRVYVGNLLYSVRKDEIESFFGNNEVEIEFVEMSTDAFTGRNPGYCFVELAHRQDVDRVVAELSGLPISERPVKINLVTPKSSGPTSTSRMTNFDRGEPRINSPLSHRRGNGAENNTPQSQQRSFDRWGQKDAQARGTNVTEQGRRLYVGGLPRLEPQATATAEIEALFSGFEVEAVSKIIPPHPSKQTPGEPGNHYYAFVDFPSIEIANAAIKAVGGRPSPWGGQLRVNFAKAPASTKPVREQAPKEYQLQQDREENA